VRAMAAPIEPEATFVVGERRELDLTEVDVVLVRTDPPFDRAYLHLTLVLDLLDGITPVINAPRGLRDANEKLYALRFPSVTPPTMVAADVERLRAFAVEQGAAVVKPIDGHGGRGVLVVRPDDDNAPAILDAATDRGRTPVVAQRYLPGVRDGDKRILLLDGEPLGGAVLRLPAAEDFRANICVGGTVEVVDLDDADRRIIDAVAPSLRADGLVFVGLDVVADMLTEVNVTSPTGLRQLTDLGGGRPDLDVIRWLEQRVAG
ncbi:MAG TPA: glutathione synthase, partial [Acidimicrobiales bacterium]|nr:glutathione synthase [Acidimicrobiales bacterium]